MLWNGLVTTGAEPGPGRGLTGHLWQDWTAFERVAGQRAGQVLELTAQTRVQCGGARHVLFDHQVGRRPPRPGSSPSLEATRPDSIG